MNIHQAPLTQTAAIESPVNSHNEWDPLEEIIVGRLEGSTIPSDHPVVTCNIPGMAARAQALAAGFRFPNFMIEPAQQELDNFIQVLQGLGITVTRPEAYNHKRKFSTPDWSSRGFCNSCPRDSMLVIGDEILETPMAWPCRYFETHSYRPILKDYFRRGARWTSAPKPQLTDELFDPDFKLPEKGA
ncbi:MAG: amidinotransferase, partial [Methylocystis sp.]